MTSEVKVIRRAHKGIHQLYTGNLHLLIVSHTETHDDWYESILATYLTAYCYTF